LDILKRGDESMVLSPRRRFLAAVDLLVPDMVPIYDSMDQYIAEKITGKKTEGFSGQAVFTEGSVWNAVLRNAIVTTEASEKIGHDAAFIKDYWLCSRNYRPRQVEGMRFVDEWGRIMETKPEVRTVWWVDGTVKSEDDLADYVPPDPHAPGRFELIERIADMAKKAGMAVLGSIHSGFTFTFEVRGGIDKLVIDMYRRPHFYRKLRDEVDGVCLEFEKMLLDAGIVALFMPDDYADNHGPFMPPAMFNKFELQRSIDQ